MSRFKTKFCWWPVRLARYEAGRAPVMEFIGWVWMQEAHLTNNINHGWIAFLDSKPLEIKCKTCGQKMPNRLTYGACDSKSRLMDGLCVNRNYGDEN